MPDEPPEDLLEPDAMKVARPGSEGGVAQRWVAPTRLRFGRDAERGDEQGAETRQVGVYPRYANVGRLLSRVSVAFAKGSLCWWHCLCVWGMHRVYFAVLSYPQVTMTVLRGRPFWVGTKVIRVRTGSA